MRACWILGAALGLVLSLPATGKAGPITYTFTQIAVESQAGLNYATINDGGTVAFQSARQVGPTLRRISIFTGDGGPLTLITEILSGNGSLEFPSINGGGTVAFLTFSGGGAAFQTGIEAQTVEGPRVVIAQGRVTLPLRNVRIPAINDAGVVAFSADFNPVEAGMGLFTGSGGPLTPVADTSGPFNAFGIPDINNAGVVTFTANLDAGGSGLFVSSGGVLTPVADTNGPFSGFAPSPSINDAAALVFIAALDAGGSGLFVSSSGVLTPVADTNGPFSGFDAPSINDAEMVAFFATLDGGGSGIFTGPDPVADKVIRTGDPLFDSTVADLELYRRALNDAGQVAFVATLADGRQVVVQANPVPEPSTFVLLGVGTLGLLCSSWRRLRRL